MKICSRCKTSKEGSEFGRDKNRADGLRRYCKPCMTAYIAGRRTEAIEKDPVEYRLRVMSEKLLQRVKDGKQPCYDHVECRIGVTTEEVMRVLRENFYMDVKRMIEAGETPTVDRIDSAGHYELGNIQILTFYENSVKGFRSANKPRMKRIRVFHPSVQPFMEFESFNHASRLLGVCDMALRRSAKSGRVGRTHGCIVRILQ